MPKSSGKKSLESHNYYMLKNSLVGKKEEPQNRFPPFQNSFTAFRCFAKRHVFNNQQNNQHTATHTEQTRRGNFIKLIRGDLITPSYAT